jgi:6-pyruvoyltetrahydropterin/6-carboxytetrahydropterin synthase
MRVELRKSFRFEAAHHLPFAPEGHRCRHIHGHGYVVEVVVEGDIDPERRWLIDYGEILRRCEPIKARLDHKLVNEIPGLESGTAEDLSIYVWKELKPHLPELAAVTVRETATSSCTYRGDV